VGQIINCIKAQDVHIYGVELERGREGRRPSAVFTLRLNHWMPHEQLLTAISDLENVTTIDEI
jgi:hypothetical protein